MIFKKKYLLIAIFFILSFQTLLFSNNKQLTSFRYFKWTAQEISLGKLISISFFSGLFISTLLNNTITSYKKINFENKEKYYEPLDNEEDMKSNIEMPPQRDIRDSQPTISVKYRVVKNTENDNFENDQNYSNKMSKEDDWNNDDDDW